MKYVLLAIASIFLSHSLFSEIYKVNDVGEYSAIEAQLEPGDSVVLSNGEWRDSHLVVRAEGKEGAPIKIMAETPGKVFFTGTSRWSIGGKWVELSDCVFKNGALKKNVSSVIEFRASKDDPAYHCRVTGIFIDGYNPEDLLQKYARLRFYGAHNRVDHCFFKDHKNKGVTIQVMLKEDHASHRIDHNYILNRPVGPQPNGFEAVQIAQGEDSMKSGDCIIEYNLFENCDGETEVVSNKSCDNIFQYNTFKSCSGTLTLRHGDRGVVRYNVFLGEESDDSGGVRVVGFDHVIENNYFSGLMGRTGGVIACYSGIPDSPLKGYFPASRTVIRNNLFMGNNSAAINLNVGYGRKHRIIRPKDIVLEGNWFSGLNSSSIALVTVPGIIGVHSGNQMLDGLEVGCDLDGDFESGKWTYAKTKDGLIYPLVSKTNEGKTVSSSFDAGQWQVLSPGDVGPRWYAFDGKNVAGLVFYKMSRLNEVKSAFRSGDGSSEVKAVQSILDRADALLEERKRYSVTFNEGMPPSGDIRDYYSTGPYWWPNPDTENGLPYIRRDGQFNPERDLVSDRKPLHEMIRSVRDLALAYFFTGDEEYAAWAVELLGTWFLDEVTGMHPNMNYAQAIPGKVDGRGTGIIDSLKFSELFDPLVLLESSKAWDDGEMKRLHSWFDEFLSWLLVHPYGLKEYQAKNNHGTAFDLQVISMARYLGRDDLCKVMFENSVKNRLLSQIENDGRQPLELKRTRSWSYTTENLNHFYRLCLLADSGDRWVFDPMKKSGAALKKALDFVLPYVGKNEAWPYTQRTAYQTEFIVPVLEWAKVLYSDESYETYLRRIPAGEDNFMAYLMMPDSAL